MFWNRMRWIDEDTLASGTPGSGLGCPHPRAAGHLAAPRKSTPTARRGRKATGLSESAGLLTGVVPVRKLSLLLEAVTAIVVVVWMARRRQRHFAPSTNAWHRRIDAASPTSREPNVAREIIRSPVVAALLTIVAALLFWPSLLGLAATPVVTPIATPEATPVVHRGIASPEHAYERGETRSVGLRGWHSVHQTQRSVALTAGSSEPNDPSRLPRVRGPRFVPHELAGDTSQTEAMTSSARATLR